MQAPQSETFPYIPKQDRDLLPTEQTTFMLQVVTAGASSASTRRYAKAFYTSGGKQELDENRYKLAYRGEWTDIVKAVKNYKFGYKYPDLQEKGFFDFDEPELIMKMFDELPDAIVREVIEAAKGESSIEAPDRKK